MLVRTALGFDLELDGNDIIAKLLLKNKIFEAPESELVTHLLRPADICVDAGCNVGYYTCLFASLVGETGRVYAFDANPQICGVTRSNLAVNNLCAEVTHAALADNNGEIAFRISRDDETGLSSVGPIAECKSMISVPCMRLDDFLQQKQIDHVRLLKIDVEGSEERVLRGLGHFLTDHLVEYILAECYDARLRLLNTSTQKVWAILQAEGYRAWEYRGSSGWSATVEVQSRADCNYLFVSPWVEEAPPRVCVASALIETQTALNAAQYDLAWAHGEIGVLRQDQICNVESREDTLIYHIKEFPPSWIPKRYLKAEPTSLDRATLGIAGNSSVTDATLIAILVDAPHEPWAYAVQFNVVAPRETRCLVEIDCRILQGTIGFGVLNAQENDFLYRVAVPASGKRTLVHLPIDGSARGRFVVQNWNSGHEARARVDSVKLYREL